MSRRPVPLLIAIYVIYHTLVALLCVFVCRSRRHALTVRTSVLRDADMTSTKSHCHFPCPYHTRRRTTREMPRHCTPARICSAGRQQSSCTARTRRQGTARLQPRCRHRRLTRRRRLMTTAATPFPAPLRCSAPGAAPRQGPTDDKRTLGNERCVSVGTSVALAHSRVVFFTLTVVVIVPSCSSEPIVRVRCSSVPNPCLNCSCLFCMNNAFVASCAARRDGVAGMMSAFQFSTSGQMAPQMDVLATALHAAHARARG